MSEQAKPTEQPPFGGASGSAIKPLSKRELAQLNAALVLIRRGKIHMAARSLAVNPDAGLALDLQAYIDRHSPNAVRSATEAPHE